MNTVHRRTAGPMATHMEQRIGKSMLAAGAILFLIANFATADTLTREELEDVATKRLRLVLTERAMEQEHKERALKEAEAVAARVTQSIDKLPEQTIDKRMADWIVTSLVELVRHRADVLLVGGKHAQSLLDSLDAQSRKVLSDLDKEKSEALIKRRNNLTKDSTMFWNKMLGYLANRLSKPEIFRVTLSIDPKNTKLLKEIDSLRSMDQSSTVPNTKKWLTRHDSRLGEIDSRLFTLSIVREVAIIMRDQATKNYIGTHVLFSLAYDDDVRQGTWIPRKFETMAGEIDKLYDQVVRVDGHTAEIYVPHLRRFVSAVKRIRWGGESGDFSQVPSWAKEHVEFPNESHLWRLLEIESEGRGEQ